MNTATIEDFKAGTILVDKHEGWECTLLNKYDDGIWEARHRSGDSVVFEREACCYYVKQHLGDYYEY
jgi:hypothetical protein